MSPKRFGEYIDEDYRPPAPTFLPDQVYASVLDNVVIACVDVVVLNRGMILMGHRSWHPVQDWWILGGRMRPGETAGAAASRNIEREAGLSIDPGRFAYLTTVSSGHAVRKQKPARHGAHTIAVVMRVTVTDEQARSVALNEEYRGLHRWTDPAVLARSEHGAMRQVASDVLALPAAYLR